MSFSIGVFLLVGTGFSAWSFTAIYAIHLISCRRLGSLLCLTVIVESDRLHNLVDEDSLFSKRHIQLCSVEVDKLR